MFKNKIILITGGSRGIGSGICKMFAKHGAKVYINFSSNVEAAHSVKKEIESCGGKAECIRGNVADFSQVKDIFQEITDNEGKLDILVNNAGIKQDGLATMMSENDWESVIQTNLSGAFYCSKVAARLMMRENAGVIINIASVSGIIGNYGQANYSSAKAGLISLTKTMAKELGRFNIRVNAIAPGLVATDMLRNVNHEHLEKMLTATPLRRIGTVEEVSQAVKFIASEDASYINGHCLVIDGGFSC